MVYQLPTRLANKNSISASSDLLPVIAYSDRFNFPLTAHEIWYWQIGTQYSPVQVRQMLDHLKIHKQVQSRVGYYSLLPIKSRLKNRRSTAYWSRLKWQKTKALRRIFLKFPFIQAIFVTGTLSVNNASRHDDIDILVITSPHTLWITRTIFVLVIKSLNLRRNPGIVEHASPRVADKICDNLWLDSVDLRQKSPSLYIAHELLQAQPLFDRTGIRHRLLTQNPWVKNYLPQAYAHILKNSSPPNKRVFNLFYFVFWPLNFICFYLQKLYMTRHITTERIGLKYAFFHRRFYKDY